MSQDFFRMTDIVKTYHMGDEDQTVLKHVNLTIDEGEFLSVLGPSGSGKSTLMNIIGCLDTPTSGEYVLRGRAMRNLDEAELAAIRSREIGFIFQSFQLLPRLDALRNVELPLVYAGVPQRERTRRAKEMLERVGLGNRMHHYAKQLSGGQQQRVAIARALAGNPSLLLADEPTGALDQETGKQVMALFGELNREGRTIIMITHDAHIASHAHRTVNVLDGVLSEEVWDMRKFSVSMFNESVRMSLDNIRSNKMRSFLTVLGIIIGVMAVIALMTIVHAVTNTITEQFTAMGTGKLTVQATGTPLKRGLNDDDLNALRAIDNVSQIDPKASLTATVSGDAAFIENMSVSGKSEVYFQKQDENFIARGRALNVLDMEGVNRVCVIDSEASSKLFNGQDPLNKHVNIGGIEYLIVGTLSDDSDADVMSQAMGGNDDGRIIIPYTAAKKQAGQRNVMSLDVYVTDTDLMDDTVQAVEAVLKSAFNYKDDSYTVINMESLLNTMDTMMGMMSTVLAGIASIALLVGGIGIMNMMLVSVTERTAEIGLRKALGARPFQIQMQFLIESFVLSLIGGLLGLVVGVVVSYLVVTSMGANFVLSSDAIALGVGFSAAVGIIFGWAPAKKASALNPIDALRNV